MAKKYLFSWLPIYCAYLRPSVSFDLCIRYAQIVCLKFIVSVKALFDRPDHWFSILHLHDKVHSPINKVIPSKRIS